MTELEETLKRICHDFANDVVAALMKVPFEHWYDDVDLSAAAPAASAAKEPAPPAPSETETSILEHLNEAGPTGSTIRAWVISTQGELPADEHEQLEQEANTVLEALEARGLIEKKAFSRSRGQVYALAPV